MSSPEPYLSSLVGKGKEGSHSVRAATPMSDTELPEPYIQAAYSLNPINNRQNRRVQPPLETPDRPLTEMEIVHDLFYTQIPKNVTDYDGEKLAEQRRKQKVSREKRKERILESERRRQAASRRRQQARKAGNADHADPLAEKSSETEQTSKGIKRQGDPELPGEKSPKRSRKGVVSAPVTANPSSSPPVASPGVEGAALALMSIFHQGRTPLPPPPSQRMTSRSPGPRQTLLPATVMAPVVSPATPQQGPAAGSRTTHAPNRKTVLLDKKRVDKTTANDKGLAARIKKDGLTMTPGCKSCQDSKRECKFLPGVSIRCAFCCARKGKCGFESEEPKIRHLMAKDAERKGKEEERKAKKAATSKRKSAGKKVATPTKEADNSEPESELELEQEPAIRPNKRQSQPWFASKLDEAVGASGASSAATASIRPENLQSQGSPARAGEERAQRTQNPLVDRKSPPTALRTAKSRRKLSSDSTASDSTLPMVEVFTPTRQESRTPDSVRSPKFDGEVGGQQPESPSTGDSADKVTDQRHSRRPTLGEVA